MSVGYMIFIAVWPIICGIIFPLLLSKGITINIVHKPVETVDKPKYNESLAGMLPPEVQEYYGNTQGQNKWS